MNSVNLQGLLLLHNDVSVWGSVHMKGGALRDQRKGLDLLEPVTPWVMGLPLAMLPARPFLQASSQF